MAHSRTFLKIAAGLSCLIATTNAHATLRIIGPISNFLVYTQSALMSNAHLFESTGAVPVTLTGCTNNRAYIDVADKELLAAAMTAQATGRAVAIAYDDNAASPVTPPHGNSTCRIKSIW